MLTRPSRKELHGLLNKCLICETMREGSNMDVEVLDTCKKELRDFPKEVLIDFLDAVARLSEGIVLTMPLSRKMPTIGKQVYELRLKDSSGIYRVIYFIKKKDAIYMVHAFVKKDQKTPKKSLDLAKKRIGKLL